MTILFSRAEIDPFSELSSALFDIYLPDLKESLKPGESLKKVLEANNFASPAYLILTSHNRLCACFKSKQKTTQILFFEKSEIQSIELFYISAADREPGIAPYSLSLNHGQAKPLNFLLNELMSKTNGKFMLSLAEFWGQDFEVSRKALPHLPEISNGQIVQIGSYLLLAVLSVVYLGLQGWQLMRDGIGSQDPERLIETIEDWQKASSTRREATTWAYADLFKGDQAHNAREIEECLSLTAGAVKDVSFGELESHCAMHLKLSLKSEDD